MGKTKTIARGYRLAPQTHNLIKKIQTILKMNSEQALKIVCKKFYADLKANKNFKNLY